jgi:hypothetical protein
MNLWLKKAVLLFVHIQWISKKLITQYQRENLRKLVVTSRPGVLGGFRKDTRCIAALEALNQPSGF